MKELRYLIVFASTMLFSCQDGDTSKGGQSKIIQELNHAEIRGGERTIALVGATLIDGTGGEPLQNATVLIRNNRIDFAGKSADVELPEGS